MNASVANIIVFLFALAVPLELQARAADDKHVSNLAVSATSHWNVVLVQLEVQRLVGAHLRNTLPNSSDHSGLVISAGGSRFAKPQNSMRYNATNQSMNRPKTFTFLDISGEHRVKRDSVELGSSDGDEGTVKHDLVESDSEKILTNITIAAIVTAFISFLMTISYFIKRGEQNTQVDGLQEEPTKKKVPPLFAEMEDPWANNYVFLVDLVVLLVIAGLTGVISFCYNFVVGYCLECWLSAVDGVQYPTAYLEDNSLFGCWLWIPICWAGGTAVGILKYFIELDEYPSFLVDIRDALQAEESDEVQYPKMLESMKTGICCMVSLLAGASLGPEAGLAASSGGLGRFLAYKISSLGLSGSTEEQRQLVDERRQLYVLGGVCAAFGTIMPSPWVSLLVVVECSLLKLDEAGHQLKLFGRRTLFLLGITATAAYVSRYAVKAIPAMPNLYATAKEAGTVYENHMVFNAALLGVIAAFTALVYAVIKAVVKKLFEQIAKKEEHETEMKKASRIIGLCSLAGLITGSLGYLVPMSLASGKESMIPTILHSGFVNSGKYALLSTSELFWIAIAKTVSYSAADAGGLVGGPFFPLLYISVVVGELCARIPINWGIHPSTLTVPVVMVAVPSAVFPLPFALVALPLSFFQLGPIWCVLILTGILTSYTLIVGTGLAKKLTGN